MSRQSNNRERLARATAQYFDLLGPKAVAEEISLEQAMAALAAKVDFDSDESENDQ
jgi:hypothetical protein